ncbi:MAG: hypothetical protein WDZ35_10690 [Crocinitomicaceae bacterium]
MKKEFLYFCSDTINMKIILTVICAFLLQQFCFSQEEDWLSYPVDSMNTGDSLSVMSDSLQAALALDFSQEDGTITVHQDNRISRLEEFIRSGEESLDGVLIDGYRVLIYFDQDKTKSEQQKANFMSVYEEHKAYVDYSAPNYRVRVGNFRTRLEADKLKQEIIGLFPTAIVVEDKIQLPNLPESE